MFQTSVGVHAAGTQNISFALQISKIWGVKQMGERTKRAPASAASCARFSEMTVPAPMRRSSPNSSTRREMISGAPGVFMAISTALNLVPTSCETTARFCSYE